MIEGTWHFMSAATGALSLTVAESGAVTAADPAAPPAIEGALYETSGRLAGTLRLTGLDGGQMLLTVAGRRSGDTIAGSATRAGGGPTALSGWRA